MTHGVFLSFSSSFSSLSFSLLSFSSELLGATHVFIHSSEFYGFWRQNAGMVVREVAKEVTSVDEKFDTGESAVRGYVKKDSRLAGFIAVERFIAGDGREIVRDRFRVVREVGRMPCKFCHGRLHVSLSLKMRGLIGSPFLRIGATVSTMTVLSRRARPMSKETFAPIE